MEGFVRVINQAGTVKMVSQSVARSRAMKAQGYWIERAAIPSQNFSDADDIQTDLTDDANLLAPAPEKGKAGRKAAKK